MSESKVEGAVEEMNKVAGLDLIQTNIGGGQRSPDKKADSDGSGDDRNRFTSPKSGRLGGALRRMGSSRRSERRKPLSSKRPIFRESCDVAEAVAAQANESSW